MATILVVDDDEPTRRIVALLLTRRFGLNVVTAANGTEALRLLGERIYDVLLVDLVMPEISGLDLIALVRGDRRHRQTPVIVMTAMPRLVREAMELGIADVLVKPFEARELSSALEGCLASWTRGAVAPHIGPGTNNP